MTRPDAWFDGPRAVDEREAAFLETLRTEATSWTFSDLRPSGTSTRADDIGRLVEIEIPGLTTPHRILRVLYDIEAEPPTLSSEWTRFSYAFEGPGCGSPDPETELWVSGVEASPKQHGSWTAAWFARQLRRRVTRREWDRPASGLSTLIPGPASGPALVVWVADQPSQELDTRGGLRWSWLQRQPASREVVERPGVTDPTSGGAFSSLGH